MKDISKRLVLILGLILMFFGTIPAYAEIIEQDNLKVKLQIEEVENSKDEFKAILTITNIGIRDIENVNIENIIPKEIIIKDENYLKKEIGSINAGETLEYEFYCNVKQILADEDENNNETIIKPETDNSNNGSSEITDTSNSALDKVETGDDNIILISVTCIVICSILIILLLKKKPASNKKFISIFICISIIASLFQGIDIVKAEENNNREIIVKENIEIDNKVYTLETKVKYKIPNNEIIASGEIVTRGEWISKLVEIFDLKNQQQLDWDEMEYPFDDIEGNQYEEDILYAYINSILVEEGDSFNSEAPATREFATVTAIRALGFAGDKDIVCEDVNDITYLKEIEVAVSMNIVNLDGNKFYPLRELTESEYNYIIEGIQGVLNSTEISEDYNNSFEYKDGVIKLSEDITYKINGTTITFNTDDRINKLKSGDIVVLPNETPYKITNITVNDDNVVIETEEPTIEETLEYIDVQGYANGDLSDFIPAEGVEVIQNNEGNARVNLDEDGSISMPGSITLSVGRDGDFASGEVTIDIPKIEYKLDIDLGAGKVNINNAYLKLLTSTEFTGSIKLGPLSVEGETKEFFDGIVELGKIPITGIPGVTVVVAVSIKYEANGTAKLVYSLSGSLGAQVLNNKLRGIKTLKSSLQLPYLEAEGKVGPKLSALIEICSYWNLMDFSIDAGLGVNGTLMIHPGLLCMDSSIFLYAELTVLDECEIKEWLDLSYIIEIWDADNSPLKWNWHLENFNKVPSCTYGEGTIKGAVVEAGNRSSFIKDSLIQVYSKLGVLIDETTSDSNGQYELSLNAGTYKIKISKNGYIPFESIESVIGGEETYIQTYLMVGQGTDGQVASAGGKITNALTGGDISDVTINIRNGWNNLQGDPLLTTLTNNQGIYNVILPLGNYTVEMIKEGYITNHYNIYVMEVNSLNQNNTLIPSSSEEMPVGDLRIVLTWGENPRDLDSHLVGPTADGSDYFHIYFANESYSENDITYADLDLDDIDSYGPETTTIYNMNNEGKYSFYVHDYTNRNYESSYEMSNSGAKIEVYKGDTLYATYNIPTNNIGTYWHVFDFDAKTNSIIPINKFVDGINYDNLNRSETLFNTPRSIWKEEEKQAS